jgi:hypothetical protein
MMSAKLERPRVIPMLFGNGPNGRKFAAAIQEDVSGEVSAGSRMLCVLKKIAFSGKPQMLWRQCSLAGRVWHLAVRKMPTKILRHDRHNICEVRPSQNSKVVPRDLAGDRS